jgi:hypothetical protein
MDKEQKRLYFIESLLTAIIIFIIVLIFFIISYEPFGLIGIPDVDQMLIRMNRENIGLFLFVNIAISFTGSILLVMVFESIIINLMPTKEVKATLKIKESTFLARPSLYNSMPAYPVYKLRFELECGKEKVISVDPILFATFSEGNKGILRYKERVFRKFIEFYIEEIE